MIQEIQWSVSPEGTRYGYICTHPMVRRRYQAAIGVVWCFDDEFWDSSKKFTRAFLRWLEMKRMDSMRFAGGSLVLSSPHKPSHQEHTLDNIEIAVKKHGITRLKLMTHHDCLYVGGIERFNGDTKAEFAFHCTELTKAYKLVQGIYPYLDIRLYFIDCQGVLRIEPNERLLDRRS